jgi:hypothetical protein
VDTRSRQMHDERAIVAGSANRQKIGEACVLRLLLLLLQLRLCNFCCAVDSALCPGGTGATTYTRLLLLLHSSH